MSVTSPVSGSIHVFMGIEHCAHLHTVLALAQNTAQDARLMV
jgi:hypothetical protein